MAWPLKVQKNVSRTGQTCNFISCHTQPLPITGFVPSLGNSCILPSFNSMASTQICVRHLIGLEETAWKELFEPLSYVDTASIFATLVRPKSRGWIRLRSVNPLNEPIIDPQYYSHPQDAQVMLEGITI
jgi:hypothetical protein